MKQIIILCLLQFLVFDIFSQKISGGSTFKIDDFFEERIFSISQLEFFEDSTNSFQFNDIIQPSFQGNFKISANTSKNDFKVHHSYWVKLSIEKTLESKKKWVLEFYDQTIDYIEVYVPNENGDYTRSVMGDALPFGSRDYLHKNFKLTIDNELDGISNYYFLIRSSQKADIRIAIRSLNRFIYYALNEYFLYGIFYGMIAIIGLFNILIYFAVREIKYLYYTFYLISVGVYAMCVDGIAFQYLWPHFPTWNQIANGIFSYSIVVWALLFTESFLSTKNRAPTLHKILKIVLWVKTALVIIGLVWENKFLEIRYYDVIPFFIMFYAGIYIWAQGYKMARFFVVAYGVLFVGFAIKVMVNAAVIPHNIMVYYSLHIAFLLEMLLLTLALGDRIRILKRNRDRAMRRTIKQVEINSALKEKVNRELEFKVKERTQELEEKSLQLEQFNHQLLEKEEEIKRINSLLDRDNWKLKSSIRASFQARLTNQLLSYEEFSRIFPDQSACYRYLEEMKWGQQFECRNCLNQKCSPGPKLFTKRCTKCGYIDSVTAGTIFHGVKFPLEKAFYIAYSQISKTEKITLDEMAEMLEIRRNTVWGFRKKIRNIIEDNGLSDPKWRDILMEIDRTRTK